jgi:hypothetical protein
MHGKTRSSKTRPKSRLRWAAGRLDDALGPAELEEDEGASEFFGVDL